VCIYVCVYSVNIDTIMQERVSEWEMLKARSFLFGILIPTDMLLYKDYQHTQIS